MGVRMFHARPRHASVDPAQLRAYTPHVMPFFEQGTMPSIHAGWPRRWTAKTVGG